ncbi:MAG: peptidyl-prolyl cis-trans isomerase [Candidatus Coatesbacteria bacterium]|nr:peptidyl-prolyl cis-trans isomerase [Candidatus Coatesbacteria bacterium]
MKFVAVLGMFTLLVLIAGAIGCGEGAKAPETPTQQAPAKAEAPALAKAPEEAPKSADAEKVIAKSGNLTVTKGEIDEVLAKNQQYSAMMAGGKPFELTPEQKDQQEKNAIRNLLVSKLILAEAKSGGLTVTDEEINEKFEQVFKMYGGKEKFLKASGRENISDDELRKEMADSIMREKYIDREVYSKIPEPSEEEMREWYEKNKSKFGSPETVKARIITVKVADGASDEDVTKAKDRLLKLGERVKKGEAFDAVAKEASEDAWASKGGDMGLIREHQAGLGSEFDKAAFALGIGKLSDPIRTTGGFCLLEVTEKHPAEQKSYEDAKEQVKNWLPGLKKFEAMGKFQSQKKNEMQIEFVGEEKPAEQK